MDYIKELEEMRRRNRMDGGPGSGPPPENQNARKYSPGDEPYLHGGKGKGDKDKPKDSEKSGARKTAGGASYPKTKDGVEYDEALSIAEHTATADGLSKEYDRVVSSLTEDDVVYQKDLDGKEYASIPTLAYMVDHETGREREVQEAYEHAAEEGKQITQDMIGVAKESGVNLTGLENSIKGGSHVSEKIDRKFGEWSERPGNADKTHADYVRSMGDAVRFTAMSKNDDMVKGVQSMVQSLKDRGYEVTEVDNKFCGKDGREDPGAFYRAVHIEAVNSNGQSFEVQIHSPDSLAIKNTIHTQYEEYRKEGTSDERKSELAAQMRSKWAGYVNPSGIEAIKSFKK